MMRKDWTIEPASAENPLTPKPIAAGDSVLFDSFCGSVPVKIVRVYVTDELVPSTRVEATVTKTVKAYAKGDTVDLGWSLFYPKSSQVLRGHEYKIRNDYHPVITPAS